MKTKYLVYLSILLSSMGSLQAGIPLDSLFYDPQATYPIYAIYNGDKYKLDFKNKQGYLYKNDSALFTLDDRSSWDASYFDPKTKRLYWGNAYFRPHYQYLDFATDTVYTFNFPTEKGYDFNIINGKAYYIFDYYRFVVQQLEHNTPNMMIDIRTSTPDPRYLACRSLIFPNASKGLLLTAVEEGGVYDDGIYYQFDETTKTISLSPQNEYLRTNLDWNIFGTSFFDFEGKYAFTGEVVLDRNYNIFAKTLSIHPKPIGWVIDNDKVTAILFQDRSTNYPGQLCPFVPNAIREKLFYQIYHNQVIDVADLRQLNALDLRLTRNMVYTKYNYEFKDPFLNAFFRLYDFYNGNIDYSPRNKDIAPLLTPVDKQNLNLIKEAEQRLKPKP